MTDNPGVDNPRFPVSWEREVPISPELQQVLDRIPKNVPEVFHRQAALATGFITLLDQGRESQDPRINIFFKEISSSTHVGSVYLRHSLALFNGPDPAVALPRWLQEDRLPFKSEKERQAVAAFEPRIRDRFEAWVAKRNYPYQHLENGIYYQLKNKRSDVPLSQEYKLYVEDQQLLPALEEERLQSAFLTLEEKGLIPDSMKLFEKDRLVLYFDQMIDSYDEVGKVFKLYGIETRGPAQDVIEEDVKPDGTLKEKVVLSNDSALGEGGHLPRNYDYYVERYTPAAFLENYLNLCLYSGKRPDEPYKTSFVYVVDYEGFAKDRIPEVVNKAQEMTGYPVCYVRSRHEVVLTPVSSSTPELNPKTGKANPPFWQRIFRK